MLIRSCLACVQWAVPGEKAVLFINLLGKGLTQEINGDGGSI